MATPEITVRASTPADAEELAAVMRKEDARECEASGRTPLYEVLTSMETSMVSRTVRFNGEVAAIYGVRPIGDTLLCTSAVVWMLTGRAISRYPKSFLRICRPLLRDLLSLYPVLENAIDARYEAALRWARWLGFRAVGEVLVGPSKLPFCHVRIGG